MLDGSGTSATNVIGTSTGDILINRNPYLYRGYRYDRETGLYYLNSRYYDPETGRFINANVFVSTGQGVLGNNMFAYCLNNPVNMSDGSGSAANPILNPVTLPDQCNRLYDTDSRNEALLRRYVDEAKREKHNYSEQKQPEIQNSKKYNQTDEPIIIKLAGLLYDFGRIMIGTTSPKNVSNPGGWYIQITNIWEVYSAAFYNQNGMQIFRIDFQGRAHGGVNTPHIHAVEFTGGAGYRWVLFDIYGNKIH